ncbi:hypothetical protein J25TS5_51030 [Paenibacillus faecis]|nr:hypothetical protein J25TS5_51030 [Paenibacillus faecis]
MQRTAKELRAARIEPVEKGAFLLSSLPEIGGAPAFRRILVYLLFSFRSRGVNFSRMSKPEKRTVRGNGRGKIQYTSLA